MEELNEIKLWIKKHPKEMRLALKMAFVLYIFYLIYTAYHYGHTKGMFDICSQLNGTFTTAHQCVNPNIIGEGLICH